MSVVDIPLPMTEDEVLAYTQSKRLWAYDQMTVNKEGVSRLPEDPAEKKVVLNILDGLDKAALGKLRIKVEEQANNTAANAQGIIAELLKTASAAQVRPFQTTTPGDRPAPTLPADIPAPQLVEGETATSAPQQSYDAFVAATSNAGSEG